MSGGAVTSSGSPAGDERLAAYVPRLLLAVPEVAPAWWTVDGTLVFTDISGFTQLTERLARQGRVGAEELVVVLNGVFTELVAATEGDGDLLKFGGDALLFLFTGADHPARGVRAAAAMRAALRRIGRQPTTAGAAPLRMSVGVASGPVDCHVVGRDHLELLVLGPTVTATVEMEATAEPGEILLAASTAAALPASALGAVKGPGLLLRRPPAPSRAAAVAELPGRSADPLRFVPLLLRDRIGTGEAHDHRRVTIAFLHLGGIDARLAADGPDAVQAHAQEVAVAVEEEAARCDVCVMGTDLAADGAKWLLAAGAPSAHEDDERRMLRVARAVLDRCPDEQLRIGVHAGHVFSGDIGAPTRRTYTVMGDTTNLAARIMGKAAPGTVLASTGVVARAGSGVVATPVEPFMVKGKTAPVHAAVVDSVGAGGHDGQAPGGALFGRDDVLAALDDVAADALDGRGALVEVVADVGMGKSRLLAEVAARHAAFDVVLVRAEPYRTDVPYGVAATLLRLVLGIDADADPPAAGAALGDIVVASAPLLSPWLPLLAEAVGAQVPPTSAVDELVEQYREDRLGDAVAVLLTAVAGDRALALLVDDGQWADAASRALVGRLAREVGGRAWLLAVTRRLDADRVLPEVPRPRTISLEALGDAEARALVRASAPPLPEQDVAAIVARAGGNPLFLLELANASASGELSASVESTVASRIDALHPDDRQVLRELAVLGSSFGEDEAGHLLGAPPGPGTWAALAPFVTRVDGRCRFVHELFREVAYEGLAFGRRRALHAAAAAAGAEGTAPAGVVALHWSRAEDWEEAWRWARLAGDHARAAHAPDDAVSAYRQAAAAGRRLRPVPREQLAAVHEHLGDVCEVAGRYAEAADAYRAARTGVADPARRSRLAVKLANVHERAGRYRAGVSVLNGVLRAVAEVPAPDGDRVRARALVILAAIRYRQGRLRACVDAARQGHAAAVAGAEPAAEARAALLLEAALADLGDPEAATWRPLALPIYERLGDLVGAADTLNNLGATAYYEGRWDEALALYERNADARRRAGDVMGAATAANNIAEILSDQGHLDAAVERFEDARAVFVGAGYPVGIAVADSNLGRALARAGRTDGALEVLDRALAAFEALGAGGMALDARARRAEALLVAGRADEARAEASAVVAKVLGATNAALLAVAHRVRAESLRQLGDPDGAAAAFAASLAAARSVGATYEEGCTLRAQGRAAEAAALLGPLGVAAG